MNQNIKEKISVIIPVFNEESSIGKVITDIPKDMTDMIVVVDNGSTDRSVKVAQNHGAVVVHENKRGYGAACLKGINYLKLNNPPDILVFLDGDYSDYPEDIHALIDRINAGYDFVLGSRVLGIKKYQAQLSKHSILGNNLAAFFLNWLFKANYTDLGPFRAIRFNKLLALDMQDRNFGWTVEMQIKAIKNRLKICEIPVRYRERFAGESKVTGSLSGSIKAFIKISYVVTLYFLRLKK